MERQDCTGCSRARNEIPENIREDFLALVDLGLVGLGTRERCPDCGKHQM